MVYQHQFASNDPFHLTPLRGRDAVLIATGERVLFSLPLARGPVLDPQAPDPGCYKSTPQLHAASKRAGRFAFTAGRAERKQGRFCDVWPEVMELAFDVFACLLATLRKASKQKTRPNEIHPLLLTDFEALGPTTFQLEPSGFDPSLILLVEPTKQNLPNTPPEGPSTTKLSVPFPFPIHMPAYSQRIHGTEIVTYLNTSQATPTAFSRSI